MDFLENLQNQKQPTKFTWQQLALDMWQKLGVNGRPPATFFKCFKQNPQRAQTAVYEISDADVSEPLKLFFWKYNALCKHK